jgi:CheY-like chemotaxis protein
MPVMSGIEAATFIRAEEKAKGLKRIPIVGLTGYANEEMKRAALAAGMDTVMTKPIQKKNLVSVLDSLVMSTH